MPAKHLTTGFYGKIPAAGDFVSRGLPGDFIRAWDRFAASWLVPPIVDGTWHDDIVLRFASGGFGAAAMAGIVMPSRDRAGRRFPLTVAAASDRAAEELAGDAPDWFDGLEKLACAATREGATADELAAALAGLPAPRGNGRSGGGLVFWTADARPVRVDAEAPGVALGRLLAREPEAN